MSHDQFRGGGTTDGVGALLDFPLKLGQLVSICLTILAQGLSEDHEAFSEPLQKIVPTQLQALWILSSGHLTDDSFEPKFGASEPVGPQEDLHHGQQGDEQTEEQGLGRECPNPGHHLRRETTEWQDVHRLRHQVQARIDNNGAIQEEKKQEPDSQGELKSGLDDETPQSEEIAGHLLVPCFSTTRYM